MFTLKYYKVISFKLSIFIFRFTLYLKRSNERTTKSFTR